MSRRLGAGIAGAAILIGVITVLARVTGFAKQLAFARTVGTNCLASAYYTANNVPNIIFEVVVGGALAGMVVPALAGAAARAAGDGTVASTVASPVGSPAGGPATTAEATAIGRAGGGATVTTTGTATGRTTTRGPDRASDEAGWIASALMSWVLVLLVPLGVLTALVAGPVAGLLARVQGCDAGQVAAVAARMLVVFAPQIPLYGMAVVLYGVLQAHRRFSGPALAPLVSSVVVIIAYLAFGPLSGGHREPATVPRPAEIALSAGTTLGVLALVLTVVWPTWRLGLRWRPTLRFPEGVAAQVRRLALAGLSALVAQQVAALIVIPLANRIGGGALPAYNYAWAVYQVPYAVLAVPIATSAFPALAARAHGEGFAALSARTTRAVVLVCGLAAGALAAVAEPVAHVFLARADAAVGAAEFARGIALFAPGLIGYGLTAHLSRVLYATGQGRAAARGTVAGWLLVAAAQVALVFLLPRGWGLGALALGQAAGITVGAALLLASVVRARGPEAVRGVARAGLAALLGGGAGFLAGAAAARLPLGDGGPWGGLLTAVPAGLAAVAAGVAVAALVDRADVTAALSAVRRRGTDRNQDAHQDAHPSAHPDAHQGEDTT
ncbi:murein biosynthesis integral membrane protein MurJ [Microbispora triticiradicis]|uniref:Virulence factor MviN n=3 Tax=Microbispora TaxID=2005 RepID=A0ABY3LPP6_9ACTN|nr:MULTISPECIES: lipid II flippase MurJ [Microbispora]TLP59893.1 virulence factor MviN [Microbispora fusca]TYB44453.1 virulence factor MviN [Microbispora tritici]